MPGRPGSGTDKYRRPPNRLGKGRGPVFLALSQASHVVWCVASRSVPVRSHHTSALPNVSRRAASMTCWTRSHRSVVKPPCFRCRYRLPRVWVEPRNFAFRRTVGGSLARVEATRRSPAAGRDGPFPPLRCEWPPAKGYPHLDTKRVRSTEACLGVFRGCGAGDALRRGIALQHRNVGFRPRKDCCRQGCRSNDTEAGG